MLLLMKFMRAKEIREETKEKEKIFMSLIAFSNYYCCL